MIDIKALEQIAQAVKDSQIDVSAVLESDVTAYRRAILSIGREVTEAVRSTSLKQHNYDDNVVMSYIQKVLDDGFNLQSTELSFCQYLLDAQQLTRFKPMIKVCVDNSSFSKDKFKIKLLSYQRSAIEQSNTLHDLRQNINAMIGPLRMHREHSTIDTSIDDDFINELINVNALIVENEQLKVLLIERDRVISEIMNVYNEPLQIDRLQGDSLLSAIDNFKVDHSCTDKEACKVFNVSRSTITRLRKGVV